MSEDATRARYLEVSAQSRAAQMEMLKLEELHQVYIRFLFV